MATFDFCEAMRSLCVDICRRHPKFRHIDLDRVVVTYAQTRTSAAWGMQAKLTPLRFENGALTEFRDGQTWACERVMQGGVEALYMLTFYLPRFFNMEPREKLVTVFHELFHISPKFDGDIRRFAGPCYMHSRSQAEYDRKMGEFATQYVASGAPKELRHFLEFDFTNLRQLCGEVVGLRVRIPRIVAVSSSKRAG